MGAQVCSTSNGDSRAGTANHHENLPCAYSYLQARPGDSRARRVSMEGTALQCDMRRHRSQSRANGICACIKRSAWNDMIHSVRPTPRGLKEICREHAVDPGAQSDGFGARHTHASRSRGSWDVGNPLALRF